MDQKSNTVKSAMDAAKTAAVKNADKIQSVKVKIKFGSKMDAVKKKAAQFGDKQKYGDGK